MGNQRIKKPNISDYNKLVLGITNVLDEARKNVVKTVNQTIVVTYWYVGKFIVEYEQKGKERAEYGSTLLKRLSKDLSQFFGTGYSWRNLYNMTLFYNQFPILQTVSAISKTKLMEENLLKPGSMPG